jgi:hypothetical protein
VDFTAEVPRTKPIKPSTSKKVNPMNRLFAALLFVSLSVSPSSTQTVPQAGVSTTSAPTHPATPEQIREYFKLVRLDKTVHTLMEQMLQAMQTTSAPYFPQSLWEDMSKTFSDYDLLADMIPIYQKHISQEDMSSILMFYRTDAGQRLLAAQPIMTAEAQGIFSAIGGKLGQEVAARHIDEIKAAKKKYEDDIAAKQNRSNKQK